MSAALQMVLAVQGWSLGYPPKGIVATSRLECVSRCYFNSTCSSILFDGYSNTCQLVNPVHHNYQLSFSSSTQYLVWNPDRTGVCKPGYTWDVTMKKCYSLSDFKTTWQDAEDVCVENGGHLFKIDTADAQTFLRSLKFGPSVWAGANDEEREGTWKWADNSVVQTTYWDEDEPENTTDKNCLVILSSSKWHDTDCSSLKRFLCEGPKLQEIHPCQP